MNRPGELVAVSTCTMFASGAIDSTISASSTFSTASPFTVEASSRGGPPSATCE